MKNSEIYKQVDDCLLEDMDGEMLLYNPNTSTTLQLNAPSAVVWQLCDGERSVQDIIDVVLEAYPEQSEQNPSDITTVLSDLSSREVLELVE